MPDENTPETEPGQEEAKIDGLNAGFGALMETVAAEKALAEKRIAKVEAENLDWAIGEDWGYPGAGWAELEAERDSLKAKVEELETQLALSGEPIPDVATGTTTGEPAEANYGTGKAFVLEAILAAIPGNHSLAEHGYYRNVEALCGELKGAVDKAETERDSFKAENARLREVLGAIEWVHHRNYGEFCEACDAPREDGHKSDCPLHAALSVDGEEEKNND